MIKSPLRYPGGKSKAIRFIAPIIPEFKEYREPFLGGGSVYLYLKQKYPHKKFWINDLYEDLFLFWSQLQISPAELIRAIQHYKDNFQDGKALHQYLLQNKANFNALQKAAAFFVLNRITFSGTTESGGFSAIAFKKRFTQTSIERVERLSKLLDHTTITNLDYEEVVKAPGEEVFIFLDPPYYSATQSALYGKNGNLHKTFDHHRFASIMKNCKHKWIITYDNSDYIQNLFSFAYILEWRLTYGMRNVAPNSNPIGNELFISNFPIPKQTEPRTLFMSP